MTQGDIRRLHLFNKYADHLLFLKDKGILVIDLKFDRTYICPVCKEQFSEAALDQSTENPLTLEDAPPKSLGGKAEVLTCKACNNTCGQKIDVHLTERLVEIDQKKFKPGVAFAAETEHNGEKVQSYIKVTEEGEITVKHDKLKNNPETLKKYLETTGKDDLINISFKDSKVDVHKLQIALLKTGFLLAFAKFGYSFILDPTYDQIRAQLKYPDENIYPIDFWFNTEVFKPYYGVPFVIEPGIEAIFPIFALKTDFTEHTFAAILPLTSKPIEQVIATLKGKFEKHHGFEAAMDAMNQTDYLFDDSAIVKMLEWIKKVK